MMNKIGDIFLTTLDDNVYKYVFWDILTKKENWFVLP